MRLNGLRHRRVGCILDEGALLLPEARIVNIRGDKQYIRVGAFSRIRGELLTFAHGGVIEIGTYCYIGEGTRVWAAKRIVIGDHVLISHNVNIFDNTTHPLGARARREQYHAIVTGGHPRELDLNERAVTIGNDVLIGCMSIVLAGVSIGEGAVVGAGSVVTHDVPPWALVAGNPARVIRILSDDER